MASYGWGRSAQARVAQDALESEEVQAMMREFRETGSFGASHEPPSVTPEKARSLALRCCYRLAEALEAEDYAVVREEVCRTRSRCTTEASDSGDSGAGNVDATHALAFATQGGARLLAAVLRACDYDASEEEQAHCGADGFPQRCLFQAEGNALRAVLLHETVRAVVNLFAALEKSAGGPWYGGAARAATAERDEDGAAAAAAARAAAAQLAACGALPVLVRRIVHPQNLVPGSWGETHEALGNPTAALLMILNGSSGSDAPEWATLVAPACAQAALALGASIDVDRATFAAVLAGELARNFPAALPLLLAPDSAVLPLLLAFAERQKGLDGRRGTPVVVRVFAARSLALLAARARDAGLLLTLPVLPALVAELLRRPPGKDGDADTAFSDTLEAGVTSFAVNPALRAA